MLYYIRRERTKGELCQVGRAQLQLGCHEDQFMKVISRHLQATQGSHQAGRGGGGGGLRALEKIKGRARPRAGSLTVEAEQRRAFQRCL